jgi:hypothetical protein
MGNEAQCIQQHSDPLAPNALPPWPEYDDLEAALRDDLSGELEQQLLAALRARAVLTERQIRNVASSTDQTRLIEMKEMLVAASTIVEAVSPRLREAR